MAMNKAEKQKMADLENELRKARAMRFTDKVVEDVPPPSIGVKFGELTTGFAVVGTGEYARVDVACSSSVNHAIGRTDKTSSQNAKPLYSTRLLALRACRNKVEEYAASRLAAIDLMIEAEINKEQSNA